MANTDAVIDISYGIVKEEGGYTDDDEEEELSFPAHGEHYIGQNLINFDNVEEDEYAVPDHDPLGLDTEDEEEDVAVLSISGGSEPDPATQALILPVENDEDEILPIEVKKIYTPGESQVQNQNNVVHIHPSSTPRDFPQLVFRELEKPLQIKSVSSLSLHECKVGPSCQEEVAVVQSLDVFRCFYCRLNYFIYDDLIRHRQSVIPGNGPDMHPTQSYDAEIEKPFACGICGKPWNQPRKALACAKFGHDPQPLYWAMFRHACPLCSEESLRFHSLAAVARHWAKNHPEKPLPSFLFKDFKNDVLPTIKLTRFHFDRASGSLTDDICGRKRPLVIENFPANSTRKRSILESDVVPNKKSKTDFSAGVCRNSKPHKRGKIKSFRCVTCLQLVNAERGSNGHTCPRRPDGKVVFLCPCCKARFTDKRTLKLHLMNYCACFSSPDSQTVVERCPYVCIICRMRFGSFEDLKIHRSLTHLNIPFRPDKELPFTCSVCGRPAMIEKEAKLCEVFGHDPTTIKKVMFNFRCGECPSNAFGFHSNYALKKHWEKVHSQLETPEKLRMYTEDDVPLPSVTLTLEQLLIYTERRTSVHLRTEFEFPSNKQNIGRGRFLEQEVAIVEDEDHLQSSFQDNSVYPRLPTVGDSKTQCEICGLCFKQIRRHMKVHDQYRFSGEPKHKCAGCGKVYYLRNSLLCHFKNHKKCKFIHDQKRVDEGNTVMEITLDDSDEEQVRIEKPTAPVSSAKIPVLPMDDKNKVLNGTPVMSCKQLDEALAMIGDDFFGESAPVPASETLTLHYGENPDTIPPPIKLTPMEAHQSHPSELKIDAGLNFGIGDTTQIKSNTDIDEVKLTCDTISLTGSKESPSLKRRKKKRNRNQEKPIFKSKLGPRPVRCTLCNLMFPDVPRFQSHMDEFHADEVPFKCEHCGKRFYARHRLKAHWAVHDPNRFKGEPKFACKFCDKKYHLEGSLMTHISVKHMGNKFKSSITGPVLLPRPNWGRNQRTKKFCCNKCPRKFAYKIFFLQHVWRQHIGKVENSPVKKVNTIREAKHSCKVCKKEFPFYHALRNHEMIHTGEKPNKCSFCGAGFRLKSGLNSHLKKHHENGETGEEVPSTPVSKSQQKTETPKEKLEPIDQAKEFKCIVCGLLFQWFTDLRKHRIIKHGNFPSDQEKTKPFGCGVCEKPYIRRSQAITCALLEHDPNLLLQEMFKYRCSECSEDSFGYHSLSAVRKHWLLIHSDKKLPDELMCEVVEEKEDLPTVVADQEKVKEILERGVPGKFNFPLVKEFDLLPDPNSNKPEPVLPPPVRIRPTPPIRIKNQRSLRSDLNKTTSLKVEPVEDEFFGSIDSVMSLADSPSSPTAVAEMEIEDVKPFIQFIPENSVSQNPSHSLHASLYDIDSNIPKDNNIDINEGIPPEFQIRRTSSRVSRLKSSTSDAKGSNSLQTNGRTTNSNGKGQTQGNQRSKALAPSTARDMNAPKPTSAITRNGKVHRKKKPKGKKKNARNAKQNQQPKEAKVMSTSTTDEENMPVISTEIAEMALASLKTSPPPRLEPEVNHEKTNLKARKLDLEMPKLSAATKSPAILKLLRRPSQEVPVSTTTMTDEQKTDGDIINSKSPVNSPTKLGTGSVSIHDDKSVQNILGYKQLQVSLQRIDPTAINGKNKNASVSALVLQLRNSKRQPRKETPK